MGINRQSFSGQPTHESCFTRTTIRIKRGGHRGKAMRLLRLMAVLMNARPHQCRLHIGLILRQRTIRETHGEFGVQLHHQQRGPQHRINVRWIFRRGGDQHRCLLAAAFADQSFRQFKTNTPVRRGTAELGTKLVDAGCHGRISAQNRSPRQD